MYNTVYLIFQSEDPLAFLDWPPGDAVESLASVDKHDPQIKPLQSQEDLISH